MTPQLPHSSGSYLLELISRQRRNVRIGQLGILPLAPGCYYYCGSACGPGGLAARIGRHLGRSGNKHWHIDYLRPWCRLGRISYLVTVRNFEHDWSRTLSRLAGATVPFQGFGSSDCQCPSHLHYFRQPLGENRLRTLLSSPDAVVIMATIK